MSVDGILLLALGTVMFSTYAAFHHSHARMRAEKLLILELLHVEERPVADIARLARISPRRAYALLLVLEDARMVVGTLKSTRGRMETLWWCPPARYAALQEYRGRGPAGRRL